MQQGRNHIAREDIPVVVKAVSSTASIDRVNVFDLLLKHRGILTTSQMQSFLNLHEHTAHRTMAELKAVENESASRKSTPVSANLFDSDAHKDIFSANKSKEPGFID